MNYRIRAAQNEKIPEVFVIGEKEVKADSISLREHGKMLKGMLKREICIKKLKEKVDLKK